MQKRKKNITIVDIAQLSGVSIATVSRIINGRTGFSQETEKKVWNVIHELGFEPNLQARGMRNGKKPEQIKNQLILRVVNSGTSIKEEVPIHISSSMAFFTLTAQQKGLFTTHYLYDSLAGFRCPLLLDKIIDGAIVGGPHKEVIEFVSQKVPTVLLDVGASPLFPELIRVNNAMADGIRQLLYKAYKLGHRNAAVVGAPDYKDDFSRNHCRIICNILNESDLTLTQEHCYRPVGLNVDNHEEKMSEIVQQMIPEIQSSKISLIVLEDESYAVSIYKNLLAGGIRIPEDVSLISLNTNFNISPDWCITSVRIDWKALFGTAIDVLKELIAGKEIVCREYLIQPIIFRGNTLAETKKITTS